MALSKSTLTKGVLAAEEKHIPGLGDTIFVRPLSLSEADAVNEVEDEQERGRVMFQQCLRTEDGEEFTREEVDQIFTNNSMRTIREISTAIHDVCGGADSGEN